MSVLEIDTFPVFRPLLEPSRYKGAYGGRGSGKSHMFASLAVAKCLSGQRIRGVCIREVQKDLRESAKLLIEDKIRQFGVESQFRILDREIRTPGGGTIIFRGMNDYTADSIKSLEGFDWAWVEEAHTLTSRSLEMLRPTIRKPGSELWFSWNPRSPKDPVDAFLRGREQPDNSIVVRANYEDNKLFPKELEDERLDDEKHNRERYGHIWLGDYEPAAQGALWDRLVLHEHRRSIEDMADIPLGRIVVAVDPAVSSEEGANEHGIVGAALGQDGRGYVLEDWTCKGQPQKWAQRAVSMFDSLEADAIVIEVNQGGDMVRHTLETIRRGLPIIEVRATRGKHVRAEPIAALYHRGLVSHVGALPELEDQLCLITAGGYEPGPGRDHESPDRADALVWAMTELFPRMTKKPVRQEEDYDQAWEMDRDPVTGM